MPDVMRLWPVQVIMRVELLYGLAGLVGSLVSGHLYLLLGSSLGNGILLLIASLVLHALSLLHAAVLLKVSVCSPVSAQMGRRLPSCVCSLANPRTTYWLRNEIRAHFVSSTADFRRTQFTPEMCLFY